MTPGIYGVQIARTHFIDDAVQHALSQGIEQVVILGAGHALLTEVYAALDHQQGEEKISSPFLPLHKS